MAQSNPNGDHIKNGGHTERGGQVCGICGKLFIPNKYRPNQEVCSSLECQYKRQLTNMKAWRERNPNYFKYKEITDTRWKESCRERARRWRQNHLEYLKLYRQEHKDQHREYMRKYMRDYRKRKKESKSPPPPENRSAPPELPQQ